MEMRKYSNGEMVLKYGAVSSDCFFVIDGKIEAKAPVVYNAQCENQTELVKFCSQHYRDVVWEKTHNGQILKEKTQ